MKWRKQGDHYVSDCGRYTIEKWEGLLRGTRVMWVLKGAAGEHTRKMLRVAKRIAEIHAKSGKVNR